MNRYCSLMMIAWTVSWASSTLGAEENGQRLAKIKVIMQDADGKTESSTQLGFVPGKRTELKIGEVKTNHESIRFDVAVESLLREQPFQHRVEIKVTKVSSGTDQVLFAPKLLIVEGQPASLQIEGKSCPGLRVDVLIEPVK